ncbi:ABC transporter substrate-binding protein [Vibrio nigripulchritudo]|uniref:ABC transporter substrate-binding protein n=1 Tax=Vibrio nigripulchritudo TaxID=28173 RepID=UPI0003B1B448|nr:ABC transporter substrate-binding protein [Vibrio nigripulchritudo]CCN73009.1 putative ABC-type dipeptide transport system,periplasmic component [Vibrio nigripulchritudo SFn118]
MKKATTALALAGVLSAPFVAADNKPVEITVSMVQIIGTIDPAKITDYTEYMGAVNLYDGLTTVNTSGDIAPLLAERWEVSEDGKTYLFHLKKGATFHDGSSVQAKDVVYSIQRLLTLNEGPAGFFSKSIDLDKLKAVDGQTVQIGLTEPSSAFLATTPLLFVVNSDKAMEAGGSDKWAEDYIAENVLGAGPYKKVSWQRGSRMMLERYTGYHGSFGDKPIDKVRLLVTNDEATVKALANKEELHLTSVYQAEETYSALAKLKNYEIDKQKTATGFYIKLNNKVAPTDDVNIRKAIAYAVDYATINEVIYEGEPLAGPLPPAFKSAYLDSLKLPEFNLDKAKQYVDQSKYAGKGKIPLVLGYVAGAAFEEEIALLLQSTLETIGFKTTLQKDPWNRVTEIASKPETTPHVNQIFYEPVYPSPDAVFFNQYHSDASGSWASMSWLQDAKVDSWIEQARLENDPAKRNEIYKQVQQYLVDNQVDIFLQNSVDKLGVHKCLKGLNYIPMQSFYFDFSRMNWVCD